LSSKGSGARQIGTTARAVRAVTEIVTAAKGIGNQVRAGVHRGEVEFRNHDVAGLTVNIARRICGLELLVALPEHASSMASIS
jgi:class 3 adenylate cyclase